MPPSSVNALRLLATVSGLAALATCSSGADPADGKPHRTSPADVVEIDGMASSRAVHTATPLTTGEILVIGGCVDHGCETRTATTEIYDPGTGSFRAGPEMSAARVGHAATRLADGRVLVTGGWGRTGLQASAELYDPATDAFEPVGAMIEPRGSHQAIRLDDGSVLVLGGDGDEADALATVERFDPARGAFEPAGSMTTPRVSHVAVPLPDDRLLVVGGRDDRGRVLDSAEIFDPATGTSSATGSMSVPRNKHDAVALTDGTVLVVGGSDGRGWNATHASAEAFDPASGAFERLEDLEEARFKLTDASVELPDGRVVVSGGSELVEVYDPSDRTFTAAAGSLDADRMFPATTLLPDGQVLITGGYDERVRPTPKAWLVRP